VAHAGATALPRTLGLRDLVLLEVVAIVNVSLAPPVAAFGVVSLWMWLAAFAAFFVPEAVAVVAFSRRAPGEGGMYLWARNAFGDLHGFLAGWCYFTNNLFYIPMQLVFVAGVLAFAAGPQAAALVDNKAYVASVALGWLLLAAGAHVRGLAVGKWVQNAGAIGTFTAVTLLVVLGVAMGSPETRATARDAGAWELASSFSVMCFAFIGIELASTMGDEIRDPLRNVPRAIAWTGVIVLCANLLMTVAMQSLVPGTELEAIQGVMQAIESAGLIRRAWAYSWCRSRV
jgi:amino acid transporter